MPAGFDRNPRSARELLEAQIDEQETLLEALYELRPTETVLGEIEHAERRLERLYDVRRYGR